MIIYHGGTAPEGAMKHRGHGEDHFCMANNARAVFSMLPYPSSIHAQIVCSYSTAAR
jgi:hypothetical protein